MIDGLYASRNIAPAIIHFDETEHKTHSEKWRWKEKSAIESLKAILKQSLALCCISQRKAPPGHISDKGLSNVRTGTPLDSPPFLETIGYTGSHISIGA
jgi:hypothetical protein